MSDNQNMNKTSMKDVQQQHVLSDSKCESYWNVSENLDFFVLCLFLRLF